MSAVPGTGVCVAGAGPAGLVLALVLREAQIPCVVLEQRDPDALLRPAGAGLIEHRTVERLGPHGLAGPILRHGGENAACEFRMDGRAFGLDLPRRSRWGAPGALLGDAPAPDLAHAGVLELAARPPRRRRGSGVDFAYRLRQARLGELLGNAELTRWFAFAYAGVDPDSGQTGFAAARRGGGQAVRFSPASSSAGPRGDPSG